MIYVLGYTVYYYGVLFKSNSTVVDLSKILIS